MKQVVLVGYGRMGKMHYDILNNLPEFQVKYIVDHQAGEQVRPVSEIEQILSDPALDGVVIVTSSDAHVDMIELCSRYQTKIYCEKPVSYQMDSLHSLRAVLSERGADVQVGLNRRFDPHFRHLKQCLASGEIGAAQMIKITNRDPVRPDLAFARRSGGLIYDFVIHDLDMVNFLCEERVTDIAIFADALIEPQLKTFADVDTAIISLKLASGAQVAIDVSRESGIGYDQRIEVLGQHGMLKVDNQTPSTLTHIHGQGAYGDLPYHSFVERYREAYRRQFQAYAQWLDNEIDKPEVGLTQMADALALADRISTQLINC